MPKRLTANSTLVTLRKDAKRRLKAIRAGDAGELQRLLALHPQAGLTPGLRDVQHAMAREYGFDGWAHLKEELAGRALGRLSQAERVDIVLHHVWEGDLPAARRIAARHPEIAGESIFTALLFGDLEAVKGHLADDPAAATAKGGPMNWEPLLYLAYGRLPVPAFVEHSPAMAGLLIDHGADPNVFFDDGWGNPFKALTGVIGLGEGVRPPHPRAMEMARLLIKRGADPFDTQALYNASIVGDDTVWLEVLFKACEAQGAAARWHDPAQGLGGRIKCSALDYLLGNAVTFNHPRRTEWLLQHGANPNGLNAYSLKAHHEEAQLLGFDEVAERLRRHGAAEAKMSGAGAFQVAVLKLQRDKAQELAARHPAYLRHAPAMAAAIFARRLDAVALLLDLGMDVNLPDANGALPIHIAAQVNSAGIGGLLIERGADLAYREPKYGGTALGWAIHLHSPDMIECLLALSRDVYEITHLGRIERLKALFAEEPDLVNAVRSPDKVAPLHCLPDDEDLAAQTAEFLLAHGADPHVRDKGGQTPEQAARKRGLDDAAEIIREAVSR
jgi:ankyrin repeat protein